ncbi:molybdate ABC transporter substrate-binding protein [Acidocella sp. KAb 2-4]|uniref:molybdate ABC transporter substrate-binding protein n=1 Tax=Acidocella sp. KAb 2-4 TaxID=2885158 RepID=UPI001D08A590|nr:molybdate ABC transporter substrate-binding protein [Acidocella sp. KAb 2-4]MCB5944026.1 molybdate ABC transporter substrate-binding protein [Acidocella sp. KAb 2-4]
MTLPRPPSRRQLAMLAALGIVAFGLRPAPARAEETSVAVAADFTVPAKRLAAAFEQKTGDTLVLSFAASGQILAQITQGAPYAVFLSADAARPRKLAAMGLAVPGSVFTYAVGRLALWSAQPGFVDAQGQVLQTGHFTHLAIANPQSAPYGAAAVQALKALGVYAAVAPKLVTGENIAQAYQFIASGNAELGFVALSEVLQDKSGSAWVVPQSLYQPIMQDAALLKAGEDDPAARAFLAYLQTPEARAIIRGYGYGTTP